jgi:hypothetical protein
VASKVLGSFLSLHLADRHKAPLRYRRIPAAGSAVAHIALHTLVEFAMWLIIHAHSDTMFPAINLICAGRATKALILSGASVDASFSAALTVKISKHL